jgi:hypothetical protein
MLVFDLGDEGQKSLGSGPATGLPRKLKHALVGFLPAVHTVQEKMGKVVALLDFMAQFITGMVHGLAPTRYAITEETAPDEKIPLIRTRSP